MSVWVRIEELSVEYYDKEALFEIAKLIGKPIQVDYATDKVTKARYARVCVEIDLRNPLVTRIWVGGFWKPVVYENITSLCFKCGKIGHVLEKCERFKDNVLESSQFWVRPNEQGPEGENPKSGPRGCGYEVNYNPERGQGSGFKGC